ncbi:MAG: dihydropteroate synthase [Pseudomonadota bacterium]
MTQPRAHYLEPAGILSGEPARQALAEGLALPLAGGPLAFNLAIVHERGRPRRVAGLEACKDLASEADLDALSRARTPLLGFTWQEPVIMGILNVTPDSFSDGGAYWDLDRALAHGRTMANQGAHLIDVGGESTRPGAELVPAATEWERVGPVIKALTSEAALRVSVDSRKGAVQRQAVAAGASLINDVAALTFDEDAVSHAREVHTPLVLMHAQGTPQTMQNRPHYEDVLLDVFDWLEARIAALEEAGIDRARVIADPGIGFGKTLEHNLALLRGLSLFHGLGVPILLGASRKSFIDKTLASGASGVSAASGAPVESRLGGSLAAVGMGLSRGVQLFRVHDVAETAQFCAIHAAICGSQGPI